VLLVVADWIVVVSDLSVFDWHAAQRA